LYDRDVRAALWRIANVVALLAAGCGTFGSPATSEDGGGPATGDAGSGDCTLSTQHADTTFQLGG
jgi:hypothetical protein